METSRDFERAIRARYSITSDYQLAKLFGVKPATISAHRTGDAKTYGEQIGYRIAELLDLDAGYVLACLAAERSKDAKVKKVWERLAELTRVAVLLPAAFAVTLTLGHQADDVTPSPAGGLFGSVYYVKLLAAWLRRRLAAVTYRDPAMSQGGALTLAHGV